MADSPSKPEPEVEQNHQSGDDENNLMDRDQEGAQGLGLGDFEVKEQDRWLPIANGWSRFIALAVLCYVAICRHAFDLFVPCVTLLRLRAAAHALPIESGRLAGPRERCQVHLIRCRRRPSHFSHDLHRSSTLVGQQILATIHSPSCLLPTLQSLPLHLTRLGRPRRPIRAQMLTSATLLQSPVS